MRPPSTRAAPFVLAGFVLAAAIVLALLGRGIATPWILIDELLHGELARGLRSGDGYSVRGHGMSVSWTYPALLAPVAWSYGWIKVLNAVVIALTAVPVYLWAQRHTSELSALAAAALTLLLPSMLFSTTLMLENLFLPLFVSACLLIALALERPTMGRQVAALGVIGLAAATRVEGLILVPVLVLLMAFVLWLERGAPRPALAVIVPAALAVALPLGRLFREPALLGNGWGLLPFERAGLTAARVLLVGGAAAAVALFLLAPRLALIGVAVFLAVSTAVVYSTIRNQSRAVLALSGLHDRDWVDDAGVRDVTYVN